MRGAEGRTTGVARVLLALIRIVNGSLGLFLPEKLIARIDPEQPPSPAAVYSFRLFGVRTILIGADLLRKDPAARAKAVAEAPLIHVSDTATATLLTATGRVPPRVGAPLILISGLNTILAFRAAARFHRD